MAAYGALCIRSVWRTHFDAEERDTLDFCLTAPKRLELLLQEELQIVTALSDVALEARWQRYQLSTVKPVPDPKSKPHSFSGWEKLLYGL